MQNPTEPIIFCDFDNTLYSKNIIYEKFPWAREFRGLSFFHELERRHGADGWRNFFQIFTRDILKQRIWREVKSSNLVILTVGDFIIQRTKILRVLPPEFRKNTCLITKKQTEKAVAVREFLEKIFEQTGKLPPRAEIFDDLKLPGLEKISAKFQIPVAHNLVKLD